MLERHQTALFGDGNGNKGIVEKISEMYEIFNSTKLAGKIIMSIIVVAGAIALSFTQVGQFVAQFFSKKP